MRTSAPKSRLRLGAANWCDAFLFFRRVSCHSPAWWFGEWRGILRHLSGQEAEMPGEGNPAPRQSKTTPKLARELREQGEIEKALQWRFLNLTVKVSFCIGSEHNGRSLFLALIAEILWDACARAWVCLSCRAGQELTWRSLWINLARAPQELTSRQWRESSCNPCAANSLSGSRCRQEMERPCFLPWCLRSGNKCQRTGYWVTRWSS